MHFHHQYSESFTLKDGLIVTMRTLYPSDKEQLAEGFGELSALSRYQRFFAAKQGLSEKELRFFTEIDEQSHYAIGASVKTEFEQQGRGVAVARFVRLKEDAQMAEPAVTVIDAWQNRGIGSLLLKRISQAALERGILVFRSILLADNPRIRVLVERVLPNTEFTLDGTTIVAVSQLRSI